MARTFRLLGKREHADIGTLIEPALTAWVKQWFGNEQISVHCTPAEFDFSKQTDWWYAKPVTGWGVYIKKAPGINKRLTLALFGSLPKIATLYETPTPLVGDCLNNAIADLAASALQALTDSKDQRHPVLVAQAPTEAQLGTGNGTIQAQLHFADISLPMIIPGALTEAVLRSSTIPKSAAASSPLVDPMNIIAGKPISLTAMLGQAQIDIGTLQSIAIGDVIRIQTRVDQPATLITREGATLCQGYVGSRNNFKSIQLQR